MPLILQYVALALASSVIFQGNEGQFHIFDNVIELNTALNALANEGLIPSIDELAALSPYQTRHLKRFGNYELDLSQIAAPSTDDLTFELEQQSGPQTIEVAPEVAPSAINTPSLT